MNEFEQCIDEWAERCREAQAECRRIEVLNAALRATLAEREEALLDATSTALALHLQGSQLEAKLDAARQDAARLRGILQAILNADERGQGLPFQEAMQQAQRALKGA